MKVLVCGGRDYKDRKEFKQILDIFDPVTIVSGGANGADNLAKLYAKQFTLAHKEYKANWGLYGVRAGPLRNIKMLDENPDIDIVIAFKGGKGTANMVTEAHQRGFQVHIVDNWMEHPGTIVDVAGKKRRKNAKN